MNISRHSIALSALTVFGALNIPTQVQAQTIEDALATLLLGVEDNKADRFKQGVWTRTFPGRYIFSFPPGDLSLQGALVVSVTPISKCKFDYVIHSSISPPHGLRLNLEKATAANSDQIKHAANNKLPMFSGDEVACIFGAKHNRCSNNFYMDLSEHDTSDMSAFSNKFQELMKTVTASCAPMK